MALRRTLNIAEMIQDEEERRQDFAASQQSGPLHDLIQGLSNSAPLSPSVSTSEKFGMKPLDVQMLEGGPFGLPQEVLDMLRKNGQT